MGVTVRKKYLSVHKMALAVQLSGVYKQKILGVRGGGKERE
jgi:hypothetical protein